MQQVTAISTVRFLLQQGLLVFESRTLSDLLSLGKVQTARLLQRMEREGLVARLERGKYVVLGLASERTLSNPLFLASHLVTPAYVSFWSALHFYSLTEQVPRRVFVAVTRQKRPLLFRGITFQFVRLSPPLFFGYRRETLDGLPVVVADEAKALLDSLYLPVHAGGLGEVARALHTALREGRVESRQLVEYARRMGSASLMARLGYLLDRFGAPSDGLPPPRGPVVLDPSRPRRGPFDSRWKVYVNVLESDLFSPGVG